MANAAFLLGSARRYRGVSGRALARSAHASQPGVTDVEHGRTDATTGRLDKLLRPLGYSLAVLPTRLGTVADAAEQVRSFTEDDRPDAALRVVWQLAADLSTPDLALRVALCIAPPASTGSSRFDALLAAVADHALTGLPRPTWLDEPWRTLAEPWDVEPVPALRAAARAATPPEIARHGVFLDAAELINI
jgi:hypothetical protein